jgi:hypothetical protein
MLYQLSYASSLGNMLSKARYPHIRSLSGTTQNIITATHVQAEPRLAPPASLEEPAASLSEGLN